MIQDYVDPYEKRADCQEDYISPPFNVPAIDISGTSTPVATGSELEASAL